MSRNQIFDVFNRVARIASPHIAVTFQTQAGNPERGPTNGTGTGGDAPDEPPQPLPADLQPEAPQDQTQAQAPLPVTAEEREMLSNVRRMIGNADVSTDPSQFNIVIPFAMLLAIRLLADCMSEALVLVTSFYLLSTVKRRFEHQVALKRHIVHTHIVLLLASACALAFVFTSVFTVTGHRVWERLILMQDIIVNPSLPTTDTHHNAGSTTGSPTIASSSSATANTATRDPKQHPDSEMSISMIFWLLLMTDVAAMIVGFLLKSLGIIAMQLYTTHQGRIHASCPNSLHRTEYARLRANQDIEMGLPPSRMQEARSEEAHLFRRTTAAVPNTSSSATTNMTHDNNVATEDVLSGHGSVNSSDAGDDAVEDEAMSNFTLQKKVVTCIDATLIAYRSLLPVNTWLLFFLTPHGRIFSIMYFCMKIGQVSHRIKLMVEVWSIVVNGKLEYGRYASELSTNPGDPPLPDCPICFESCHRCVVLPCDHRFCEVCIVEWLDKERTCPVCRAIVPELSAMNEVREQSLHISPILI